MAKILSIRLDKGTFSDKYSSIITNPNSASFKKDIKGYCLQTIGSKYLLVDRNPLPLNGIYTVVIWAKTIKGVFNMGLSSVGIYAPGLVLKHVALDRAVIYNDINNFKVLDGVITDKWHCFIFTSIGNSQSDFISSKLYLDNKELPIFSITNTAPQIVRDFRYIGGSNISDKGASISKIEIYDHVLTSKEREKEQAEFEAAQPLTYQKRQIKSPKPTELKQQGLIAAYNKIRSGIYNDLSASGKHGTVTNCLSTIKGIRLHDINSKVVLGNIGNVKSVSFKIKLKTTTQPILEKAANSGLIHVSGGTLTSLDFANKYVNGIESSVITANQWHNVTLTSSTDVNFSAATLGLNNTTYGNFEIEDLRFYSTTLSLQEIKSYHNNFNEVIVQESFNDMAVGSSRLPNGWIKNGGSFVCGENTTNDTVLKHIRKGTKYLKCNTAGIVAIPCKQAYGTWEFDVYKGGDVNIPFIQFISPKVQFDYTTTSGGYDFRINENESIRFVKTANNALFTTTNNYFTINTWYRIRITRATTGVFTVYILGGNFTTWTLVSTTGGSGTNPVTDNTYTTSSYFVMDLDANDRIGNILIQSQIKV